MSRSTVGSVWGRKSLWNVVLLANDRPNNIKLLGLYENQRKRVLKRGLWFYLFLPEVCTSRINKQENDCGMQGYHKEMYIYISHNKC